MEAVITAEADDPGDLPSLFSVTPADDAKKVSGSGESAPAHQHQHRPGLEMEEEAMPSRSSSSSSSAVKPQQQKQQKQKQRANGDPCPGELGEGVVVTTAATDGGTFKDDNNAIISSQRERGSECEDGEDECHQRWQQQQAGAAAATSAGESTSEETGRRGSATPAAAVASPAVEPSPLPHLTIPPPIQIPPSPADVEDEGDSDGDGTAPPADERDGDGRSAGTAACTSAAVARARREVPGAPPVAAFRQLPASDRNNHHRNHHEEPVVNNTARVEAERQREGGAAAPDVNRSGRSAATIGNNNDVDTGTGSVPVEEDPPFEIGDHVYQWCSFIGIPAAYQHHAIVLDVRKHGEEATTSVEATGADAEVVVTPLTTEELGEEECKNDGGGQEEVKEDREKEKDIEWIVTVADFDNLTKVTRQNGGSKRFVKSLSRSSSTIVISNSEVGSCIRIYETSTALWKKVEYSVKPGLVPNPLRRSGTYTAASSSPPGLVRARMDFLVQHPEYLPKYDAATSNCECVAVWCKTGTWATVQATSFLGLTAASQVKSTAVLGSVAAASTASVQVPAAGLWGWLGYTSTATVPLLTAQPFIVPALAAYGVVTVGAPLVLLWRCKRQFKDLTVKLNEAFWESAVDRPDVFVECITEWSALGSPSSSVSSPATVAMAGPPTGTAAASRSSTRDGTTAASGAGGLREDTTQNHGLANDEQEDDSREQGRENAEQQQQEAIISQV